MVKPYRRSQIPNFSTLSKEMRNRVVAIANTEVRNFADRERNLFVARIKAQDFTSFHRIPLAPVTLARKHKLGLDMRTMIATGHYTQSIRVFFRKGRTLNSGSFRIGFHPLAHARDENGEVADILLNDVAAIQEYGSAAAAIPARPHWRPHLQDMARRATVLRQRIATKALAAINKHVMKAK